MNPHSNQRHPTSHASRKDGETVVDWMLRRLENCSRDEATQSFATRMTSPPVANEDDGTVGTEHQLTRQERLKEQLYDIFVKMRNLLEEYAPPWYPEALHESSGAIVELSVR